MSRPLTDAEVSFYSTAAQVIPVLLLAMAVELRTPSALLNWMRVRDRGPGVTAALIVVTTTALLLMVAAELIALSTLRFNHAESTTDEWVTAGLAVGILLVAVGVADKLSHQTRATEHESATDATAAAEDRGTD